MADIERLADMVLGEGAAYSIQEGHLDPQAFFSLDDTAFRRAYWAVHHYTEFQRLSWELEKRMEQLTAEVPALPKPAPDVEDSRRERVRRLLYERLHGWIQGRVNADFEDQLIASVTDAAIAAYEETDNE